MVGHVSEVIKTYSLLRRACKDACKRRYARRILVEISIQLGCSLIDTHCKHREYLKWRNNPYSFQLCRIIGGGLKEEIMQGLDVIGLVKDQ